jgi:hypothetical protein
LSCEAALVRPRHPCCPAAALPLVAIHVAAPQRMCPSLVTHTQLRLSDLQTSSSHRLSRYVSTVFPTFSFPTSASFTCECLTCC